MKRNVSRSQIRTGDTVVGLAARLMGDPTRWPELVKLNSLRAPYIAKAPAAGVLAYGDMILYPYSGVSEAPVDSLQLEIQTYKRDWLSKNRDLVMNRLDIVAVSGLENLREALSRRIRTPLGTHPFHPGYGSNVALNVGEIPGVFRLNMLATDAQAAIMRDPRVEACSVSVEWMGLVARLVIDVTPIPPGAPFRFTEDL